MNLKKGLLIELEKNKKRSQKSNDFFWVRPDLVG